MPDEPTPPPPPDSPPEPPQPPVPVAPPLGPPPFVDPLPPPIAPGASRVAGFGKFTGGCLLTIVAGFLLAIAFFKDLHKDQAMGCAATQLIYIVPTLILLFRKRQQAWAFGILFGGAIVFLLASICGDMNFH